MTRRFTCGLAIAFILGSSFALTPAQEGNCKLLDSEESRRFLPDRVPMEMDVIPVDSKSSCAIQFPDKTRMAVAGLATSGMPDTAQRKYQFVLITEARLRLDRWNIPAGVVALAFAPESKPDAATRTLIVRDFSGSEIERIVVKLDPGGPSGVVSLTPKGPKEFDLRIGKYVIQGKQN